MRKQIAKARGSPRSDELVVATCDSKFGPGPSVWTDHVAKWHVDGVGVEACSNVLVLS